ncbi:RNA-directed DNA polymerase from mobile element jockey [Paramuricea clavata]|uniref:RNA-directed DNA polymerase from mobile element jockey n=1 Tax=Paramuricea clavata TaxID=317549 RepID=A0A7D9IS50_PARCT|nr:RNA-directed DNA polymerase from mobile element jockey [Paramuricea clavata]
MNVSKSFWLWTRSFLEGRSQQVKLRGALLSIRPCLTGVPQGSVISPTLFNVHVDDLEDCIPNHLDINTHKYAYDCTQDEVIPYRSPSNMQEVLDTMNDWALRNKTKLYAKKTKDMWICFKAAIPEPPSLKIGNDTIERVNSFKLLGLWINNTLKWNTHIEEITKKANKRLFYLRECRRSNLPT